MIERSLQNEYEHKCTQTNENYSTLSHGTNGHSSVMTSFLIEENENFKQMVESMKERVRTGW